MATTKTAPLAAQQRAQAVALIGNIITSVKNALASTPSHASAQRSEQAKRLDPLEKYINTLIQINLSAWQQQADNAITDCHVPAEEESRIYFYLALGGNLLWASTCFLDPAIAVESSLIKIASFEGAIVGSNIAEQFKGSDASPDGKAYVRESLAKNRGALEQHFKTFRREWAINLDGIAQWEAAAGNSPERLLDVFDAYIWDVMFPAFPYTTDRFDLVRRSLLKVIQSALADFDRQWKEYRRYAAYFGEAERKKRKIYFRPVLKMSWNGKLLSEGKFY